MARRTTRTEARIEAQLDQMEPGSKRHDLLAAVRDFKASWIDVGERLTEVREKQLFRGWGFAEFEAYCRRELSIKSETANKLTRSYGFLRDHEPNALEQRESRAMPPLDVVDLLSQARERADVSDQDVASVSAEVFAAENAPSRNQVMKRFREIDPEAFKAKSPPRDPSAPAEVRKALLLAERLQGLVADMPGASERTQSGLQHVVDELRQLFESKPD